MYLIADNGSAKCSWSLVDKNGQRLSEFCTIGFNPYFHRSDFISSKLWESDEALKIKNKVKYVFSYGAGCSSERLNKIVSDALENFFLDAEVLVDHDLLASSYSTYFGKPVISCILGTGSNSSYFDGEKMYEEIPSLAYILGDEASGTYFAKMLIRDFYYKRLPDDIWQSFNDRYRMSEKDIIKKVYSDPNPNVFLAGFMPFIGEFRSHPYIKNWMICGFRKFIDIHVKCYDNWKDVEVSFIGSIAYHFQDYLLEACGLEEINLGTIIERPIENLIRYHIKYIIPKL